MELPSNLTPLILRESEAKQLVLDECCLGLYGSSEQNGGRKPFSYVAGMVKDLKDMCP